MIKKLEKFSIIVILIYIFTSTFLKLRYSIVANDDVEDFIPYKFTLWHGRVFFELLSYYLMIWLPEKLNIPIQNFAIISSVLTKSILWTTLIYLICSSYNKFKNETYLLPIILIITNFVVLATLKTNDFGWTFDILQYFTGYTAAPIFWILFWKKLYNLYTNEQILNKKNIFLLTLYSLLTLMGNEELNITTNILLIILFLFERNKTKDFCKLVLYPFFAMNIINLILYTTPNGATKMVEMYNLQLNLIQSPEIYTTYLKVFTKKFILENILIFIPIFASMILLIKNKSKNSKTIKYIFFTIISFFLYTILLLHIPHNAYMTQKEYPFWFLHCGLISTYEICLITISIFILGYTLSKEAQYKKTLLIILTTICFLLHIHFMGPPTMDLKYCTKESKIELYKTDKITTFYLKKNKTAIISKDVPFGVSNFYEIDDLRNNKEIYTKTLYEKDSQYLKYIKHEYKVDISKGITFLPEKEAMNLYFKEGGSFTDEEIRNLDFKEIKNNLNNI